MSTWSSTRDASLEYQSFHIQNVAVVLIDFGSSKRQKIMEKIKNVSLSLSESFQPSDIYLIPEYLQLQGLSTEDGTDRQTVLLFF